MKNKSLLFIIGALFLAYLGDNNILSGFFNDSSPTSSSSSTLMLAYNNQQSNKIIIASGSILRLLRDDNEGRRHQKFIVRISPELSILIAHNIDLAPRINSLKEGDHIEFKGEYEWNSKGGVVHWTHHDPQGSHPGGWVKHRGKMYQ
ncbi:MAG: hypothetical protein COB26_04450 [Piscirickettsiaceae bacterium]|nr:MAG: hypothetical protein COB26_04450 [Piscirickettsiaceae bacterium]